MKKILTLLTLLSIPMICSAEWLGGRTPSATYGAKFIEFGIDSPPADKTCSFFGRHMRFDATTPEGKNIFTMLMTAIATNRTIDIWYVPSDKPGTDHTTGCRGSSIATVTAIGLK